MLPSQAAFAVSGSASQFTALVRSLAADKQSLKFKTVCKGQVLFLCTFCERRAQASCLEKVAKQTKGRLKHLSVGILWQHPCIDAFVTILSPSLSRIFYRVLHSEALRYDKALCLKS